MTGSLLIWGEEKTIEEARKVGKCHADDAGPYYSEIFDKDGKLIEYIK